MDKLFFDTNVLLDVLERRDPWFPEAVECLGLARAGRCVGAVSAITLSDIAYIQRATDTAKIYAAFEQLVGFLDIATLDRPAVAAAMARRVPDIEDGFQMEAAVRWGASHLLTRNLKDFPRDERLRIVSPAEYLA
jgi:predicted nucleic acid-binding protein